MNIDKHDIKSTLGLIFIVGALTLGGEYLWSGFYWLLGGYFLFRFMMLILFIPAALTIKKRLSQNKLRNAKPGKTIWL